MSETLGPAVPGPCFLCGGERLAWRDVTMCATCSAMTPVTGATSLDDLHEALVAYTGEVGGGPVYATPDTDTERPERLAELVKVKGCVLENNAWPIALVMAGADVVRFRAGEGGHAWMGICMTTPTRKTLDAAMSIAQKPLMAARHTVARWESRDRADEPTGFELWTRGETVPMGPWRGWVAGYVLRLALWLFRWASGYDLEHCRRESHQAQIVASCGILALRAIAQQCHQEIDDDDNDWHRDPFLCGMRAGRRAALSELESAAGYSFQDLVRRVLAK